jgi:hypothetical protein
MFKPINFKDRERLFNREIKRRKDSIKQLVRFILRNHESGGGLSEANHFTDRIEGVAGSNGREKNGRLINPSTFLIRKSAGKNEHETLSTLRGIS